MDVSVASGRTRKEVLGPQVADAQAQDGQFVQTGSDLLRERQQARQALQLTVQAVPVPFGRVGLRPFSWRLFDPENKANQNLFRVMSHVM